jgi:hypothetical protein
MADANIGEDYGILESTVYEFKRDLLEDYRLILRDEVEYLLSDEAIEENIKANEYEFTEEEKLV